MSLHEFQLLGDSQFVGLKNYIAILSGNGQFITALFNTFVISAIVIPVQVIAALFFAIMLNSAYLKLKKMFRSLYLLPVVMSTTALSIVFVMFLSRDGLLNIWLSQIGISGPNWLHDPLWAKFSVAFVLIWKRLGLGIVIFLAGLQGVPQHLYKAAKVDGANRWQRFRHITFPQLRPITILVTILSTSYAIRMFATPYVLTRGGPGNASKSIVQLLYETAFQELNLGRGAAMGTILALILSVIMILQYRWGSTDVN